MKSILEILRRPLRRFGDVRVLKLYAALLGVITISGMVAAMIEMSSGNALFQNVGDGLWWAFVTMTTVGYGDKYPITWYGRFLGIVIMFSGISFTATFTAIVASYFVEKRMREAKGMEEIKWKRHLILCGWNSRAMRILHKLVTEGSIPIVLLNELPEEHVANILQETNSDKVKYVRGDFVHEGVLNRANLKNADAVVILVDTHGTKQGTRPDDRTVLAAFAARSINSQARICAEVEHEDAIAHLKRANVDTIVHTGAYNSFFIANAALSPGVTLAIQDLLTWDYGHSIKQRKIPPQLHERPYKDAFKYFREKENDLLIGVISEEEEGMGLDDILTGDMSAIDKFIKKKFEGLENTYFSKRKRFHIRLNPADDYQIRPTDLGIVIAPESGS